MSSVEPDHSEETLVDLLIKQATAELSSAEREALDKWDLAVVLAKQRELDQLLAALSFGIETVLDTPPPDLKARIVQQGFSHFASLTNSPVLGASALAPRGVPVTSPARRSGIAGWLAAAACLLLAIIGWIRPDHVTLRAPPVAQIQLNVSPPVISKPTVQPRPKTLAEQRDAMLARLDTLKVTLSATKDPAAAGVSADVVWDPEAQSGFLHLAGLKPNDPQLQQYQAWIFDGARDKRYPIDVAIFNIPSDSSEAIIPVQAVIPVKIAKAFAVTVEKAGGAVVPDRAHVVVVGSTG